MPMADGTLRSWSCATRPGGYACKDNREVLSSRCKAHMALELVDRRCLRSADDVERNGLVGLAAEAAELEEAKPGIERITESR